MQHRYLKSTDVPGNVWRLFTRCVVPYTDLKSLHHNSINVSNLLQKIAFYLTLKSCIHIKKNLVDLLLEKVKVDVIVQSLKVKYCDTV